MPEAIRTVIVGKYYDMFGRPTEVKYDRGLKFTFIDGGGEASEITYNPSTNRFESGDGSVLAAFLERKGGGVIAFAREPSFWVRPGADGLSAQVPEALRKNIVGKYYDGAGSPTEVTYDGGLRFTFTAGDGVKFRLTYNPSTNLLEADDGNLAAFFKKTGEGVIAFEGGPGFWERAKKAVFPMQVSSGERREGGATCCLSAKISLLPDQGLIESKFWVRKSGIFGDADCAGLFVFYDEKGNTIWKTPILTKKVGSDPFTGLHAETASQPINVPLNVMNLVAHVAVVAEPKDKIVVHLPGPLDDVIKRVGDEIAKGVVSRVFQAR